jgi:ribose/xylose/arabinose/galactoside ABC-type transport system permease subunit
MEQTPATQPTQSAPPAQPLFEPTYTERGHARMQEAGLLIVILILGAVLATLGRPIFLRPDNLIGNIATPMASYTIMAVGVTCVIIAGGIDISVGAIYALSALGTAAVLQELPENASAMRSIPIAIVVACGIGTLCGLLNGILVVALRMHPFIVTLGTMSIFRGIGNVSVRVKQLPSQGRLLPESFTDHFMMYTLPRGVFGLPNIQPMPIIIALVIVAIGWFYLSLTVWGRQNYAVGGNEEAARFSGLPVGRIKLRVYALSGLTAGIAGLVLTGFYGSVSTNAGRGYELMVIAAAVVGGASLTGGRGTALGALLGALVIRMIENGIFILKLNQEYSSIIVGSAIIVAVAVDNLSEHLRQKRLAGAKKI